MRLIIIIGIILVAGVVFGVYSVEQRVETLRAELKSINRQLKSSKERIHVLNAEWSYLNQPARLRKIADSHLGLKPMAAAQVKDIEEIPLRPMMVGSR